jgi:hypothetical protein
LPVHDGGFPTATAPFTIRPRTLWRAASRMTC